MDDIDKIISVLIHEIKKNNMLIVPDGISVGISNRHIHLSEEHMQSLFGKGTELHILKELSQPGQYACKECVTLVGPKGCIENVRILGPTRRQTQVEILSADCYKLGVKAPLKISGELDGTPGLVISGPKGCEKLTSGVIIAKRHIHMTPQDAAKFNCNDNDIVKVECQGERGGILGNVVVRVTETSKLDFHIDVEEANCMGMNDGSKIIIINENIK